MKDLKKVSRKLSAGLRHKPMDVFGKELTSDGFIDIPTVLNCLNINRDDLLNVVNNNDKNRFEIIGENIRARQGHTIKVDLGLKPEEKVPHLLFHGTIQSSSVFILKNGLSPMQRTHVHLSEDIETAEKVGNRRVSKDNPLVLLIVHAKVMQFEGFKFYKSSNGVWLTDKVPTKYIQIYEDKKI